MPYKEVKTIRDLIYYQYAKIIGKSAFGKNAKKEAYGFVKKIFRHLQNDEKKWSEILREDKQPVFAEKECVYCGSTHDLQWDHIIPGTLKINDECAACDRIQGIHNRIWACRSCLSMKGTMGLYSFFRDLHPEAKILSDILPSSLEKKYLETIYYCHQCRGTLDWDGDGKWISVLDLDL